MEDINVSKVKKNDKTYKFNCPIEDRRITFVYQYDDKIINFTHVLPKQEDELLGLKMQFEMFAQGIYNTMHNKT